MVATLTVNGDVYDGPQSKCLDIDRHQVPPKSYGSPFPDALIASLSLGTQDIGGVITITKGQPATFTRCPTHHHEHQRWVHGTASACRQILRAMTAGLDERVAGAPIAGAQTEKWLSEKAEWSSKEHRENHKKRKKAEFCQGNNGDHNGNIYSGNPKTYYRGMYGSWDNNGNSYGGRTLPQAIRTIAEDQSLQFPYGSFMGVPWISFALTAKSSSCQPGSLSKALIIWGDHRASGPADFGRFVEVLVLIGFAVVHDEAGEIHLSAPSDLNNRDTLRLRRPSTNDGWWPCESIDAAKALSAYGLTHNALMELDDAVQSEFILIPDF
ncbi:hypothetical protein C8Q73DRAFT_665661 [Cubamyces lactineus]|nr:hypothetical protein C8Q73DRAFT_665661 [Cubamyces lactineus]